MRIRPAEPEDLAEITGIYGDSVINDTASFELVAPDVTEMAIRWQRIVGAGYPYLVAVIDGAVAGYAYAGPYNKRPGYQSTLENAVYVNKSFHQRGIGKALLSDLIEMTKRMGIRQMIAVIGGIDNVSSIRLHERLGFDKAGTLKNVGYKHGRWLDVVIMQRSLGDADQTPPQP